MRWLDLTNDGKWDILAEVPPTSGTAAAGVILYTQDSDGLYNPKWSNPGAKVHGMAFADFDNDNDVDVAISQTTTVFGDQSKALVVLQRNDGASPNLPPMPPANLHVSADSQGVHFTWDASRDDHTPVELLTYNLWVGTARDTFDVLVPMADLKTGYRRVAEPGNGGEGTTHTLYHLPEGTYHWGVQAIDGQFIGSRFTTGRAFTISEVASNINLGDTTWVSQFLSGLIGSSGVEGQDGDDSLNGDVDSPGDRSEDSGIPPTLGDDRDGDVQDDDISSDETMLDPSAFAFHAAYPNPFVSGITLSYDLETVASVNLTVFNTLGRAVDVLVQRVQRAGRYTIEWDGTDRNGRPLPVGVYYARLEANDFVQVRSFVHTR